jgi:Winged helix DNA-binding domain
VIYSGPLRGRQNTYALLDERVPPARSSNRNEALVELTLCYFTSRGSATAKDFRVVVEPDCGRRHGRLDLVESGLQQETVDGLIYWFAEPHEPVPVPPSPTVHLLQGL